MRFGRKLVSAVGLLFADRRRGGRPLEAGNHCGRPLDPARDRPADAAQSWRHRHRPRASGPFFHPRLMSRLLAADSAALLEAPLKFAVIGFPDGQAELRWLDPATAFARYRSPALTELGNELAGLCEGIVNGIDLAGTSK